MSQTYTDNCFATDHAVQTDMQNMENNFAALKSAFSGATTPADTVAGMWWFDTTTNILKLRNEANNAWQSVWDFANNKPVITNLSGEITGAMIAAAIKDPAVGTAGLRTLGTGAQQAASGSDSRFGTVPNGYVIEAKLGNGAATQGKLQQYAAGNYLQGGHATERTTTSGTYKKVKEIYIPRGGTLRVKFDLHSHAVGYLVHGKVYRNGGAVGTEQSVTSDIYATKSQDIAGWTEGDLCQVYAKKGNITTAYVRSLYVYASFSNTVIGLY